MKSPICLSRSLSEVQDWLKTVPTLSLEPVKCGNSSLDEPVVEAIELAIQKTKVNINRNILILYLVVKATNATLLITLINLQGYVIFLLPSRLCSVTLILLLSVNVCVCVYNFQELNQKPKSVKVRVRPHLLFRVSIFLISIF